MSKRALAGVIAYILFTALLALMIHLAGPSGKDGAFFFGWLFGLASAIYALYLLILLRDR